MSNDMISVPRELLERALRELMDWEAMDDFEAVKRTHDELRALLAQPNTCTEDGGQFKPVAFRYRLSAYGDQFPWSFTENGAALGDHLSYEQQPLFVGPPAQAPMVLPAQAPVDTRDSTCDAQGRSWNACIDEFKRLNPTL